MSSKRDRAYWDDVISGVFAHRLKRDGACTYAEAYDEVSATYPEYGEFVKTFGEEFARDSAIKRMVARFRLMDRDEHEQPTPTPPHIREAFLPFHINVPPLSPTISTQEGNGRLSAEAASPKQHKTHHRKLRLYHERGAAYRQDAEEKWTDTIKALRELAPHLEHVEDRALFALLEALTLEPVGK